MYSYVLYIMVKVTVKFGSKYLQKLSFKKVIHKCCQTLRSGRNVTLTTHGGHSDCSHGPWGAMHHSVVQHGYHQSFFSQVCIKSSFVVKPANKIQWNLYKATTKPGCLSRQAVFHERENKQYFFLQYLCMTTTLRNWLYLYYRSYRT